MPKKVIAQQPQPTKIRTVTIYWPEDIERSFESYGPFADEEAQNTFVTECQYAQLRGWDLLDDAHYLIDSVMEPFDPKALAKEK